MSRGAFFPAELGRIHYQKPADPAAGANFAAQVPADEVWLPLSVKCRLTTDANVANRIPIFSARGPNATDTNWLISFSTAQTASQTRDFFLVWGSSRSDQVVNLDYNDALPLSYIPPGGYILSSFSALQAGDQISDIVICALVWKVVA